MAIFAKAVDGYANTNKMFDPTDIHQQPDLSFFNFAPMTRERWVTAMVALYPMPKDDDPVRGITNVKQLVKDREVFVNRCIDVFIARGPKVKQWLLENPSNVAEPATLQFLEVVDGGLIRRGIIGTMVHIAEPSKPGDEDLSDVAVLQSDWIHDPNLQADYKERMRKSQPAKLTTGELEELLAAKSGG